MVTYDRNLATWRRSGRNAWSSQLRTLGPTGGAMARRRMLQGVLYQQTADGLRNVGALGVLARESKMRRARKPPT